MTELRGPDKSGRLCDEADNENTLDRRVEQYEELQQIVADKAIVTGGFGLVLIKAYFADSRAIG